MKIKAAARQLGASDVFNARDADCGAKVREATSGGVDAAFEMAGSVRAMDLAYRMTRRGGVTVTAGLSLPESELALKHVSLVAEKRTIRGSYIGGCVPLRDVPRYVSHSAQGRLPVDRLVTNRIRLDGINEGFDRLREGNAVRQIINFD